MPRREQALAFEVGDHMSRREERETLEMQRANERAMERARRMPMAAAATVARGRPAHQSLAVSKLAASPAAARSTPSHRATLSNRSGKSSHRSESGKSSHRSMRSKTRRPSKDGTAPSVGSSQKRQLVSGTSRTPNNLPVYTDLYSGISAPTGAGLAERKWRNFMQTQQECWADASAPGAGVTGAGAGAGHGVCDNGPRRPRVSSAPALAAASAAGAAGLSAELRRRAPLTAHSWQTGRAPPRAYPRAVAQKPLVVREGAALDSPVNTKRPCLPVGIEVYVRQRIELGEKGEMERAYVGETPLAPTGWCAPNPIGEPI